MTSRLLLARSFLALVHSMDLVVFVHSMDLQPFAMVLNKDLVLFVHSMDLQPFAMVLSKDLVLFVHSMDLQPFAMVLSKDLAQDDLEDLILQSTLKILYFTAVRREIMLAFIDDCNHQVGLVLLLSSDISFDCLFFAAESGMRFLLAIVPPEKALWSNL